MASPVPARGFVANLYAARQPPRVRPRKGRFRISVLLTIALGCALVGQLIVGLDRPTPVGGQESSYELPEAIYEFKVYALNHSERISSLPGTLFRFDTQDLPIDFDGLKFGDFRADAKCSSTYYGGLGLLLQSSGSNARLTLQKAGGETVSEITYVGQSLVVIGGWETVSRDSDGSTIEHNCGAMEIFSHDWRDGGWNPEDGILVAHPSNVTLTSATLCLMVFEPSGGTSIPEFSLPLVAISLGILLIVIGRLRTWVGSKESSDGT